MKQPHPILDELIARFNLRNDAQLSRVLGFDQPYISRVRSRKIPHSPILAIAIHEVFDMSFAEMRALHPEFIGSEAPVKYVMEEA